MQRAASFLRLGDPGRAAEDASAAMRIEPANVDALALRGDAYVAKGDFERAIDDYSAAIYFRPAWAPFYRLRGIAYRKRGDRERAIADLQQALKLNQGDDEARAALTALGVKPADWQIVPTGKSMLDVLK